MRKTPISTSALHMHTHEYVFRRTHRKDVHIHTQMKTESSTVRGTLPRDTHCSVWRLQRHKANPKDDGLRQGADANVLVVLRGR